MVTQGNETREKPACALSRIIELAAEQAVIYGSSRVQNHIDALGYSFEAVCECLVQLRPDDFKEAVRYGNGPWLDVYLMSYNGPDNQCDPLYIKLKLDRDCVCIVLCSFHREGAL